MKTKVSILFYAKRAKANVNGLVPIYTRITINGKRIELTQIMTTKNQSLPKVKLTWTDSKSALIEMLYALYYQGSFNNGTADIKDIANYFEAVFNIDLGDVYRS